VNALKSILFLIFSLLLISSCTRDSYVYCSDSYCFDSCHVSSIISIFDNWDIFIEDNKHPDNILHHDDTYLSFSSLVHRVFNDNHTCFMGAVSLSGRNGRLAVIRTTDILHHSFIPFDQDVYICIDWLSMIQISLMEDTPTIEYILQLFHDSFHFGHEQMPSYFLFKSRIWHSFISDIYAFLEASSLYNNYWNMQYNELHWLIRDISNNIATAMISGHTMFYNNWMRILNDVNTYNISYGANHILESLYINIHEILYSHQYSLLWFESEYSAYISYEMQSHRQILRPHAWTEYFDWISQMTNNSLITSSVEHLNLRLSYFITCPWFLFFPLAPDNAFNWVVPHCPIWQLSSVNNHVRYFLIHYLINHIIELQNHGYIIYIDIVNTLTDHSRIFDPRTNETSKIIMDLLVYYSLHESYCQ